MAKRDRYLLYRIFNDTGQLLYVGTTTNPALRFDSHHHLQPWWDDAAEIKLERLENWETLLDAEMTAIVIEKPRYNVIHSITRRTPTQRKRRPNGEGSVCLRSDGMWIANIELPPGPDGKRRQKRAYSKDRATAERKLALLKQEAAEGRY
jgi:hypothetical protein